MPKRKRTPDDDSSSDREIQKSVALTTTSTTPVNTTTPINRPLLYKRAALGILARHYRHTHLYRLSRLFSSWKVIDPILLERFQKYFPDILRKINSPEYKQFHQFQIRPDLLNGYYFKELDNAFLQYTCHFNAEQLEDYAVIRSLNYDGISQILNRTTAINDILICDNNNNSIFDFLARCPDKVKRQKILDHLFLVLKQSVKDIDTFYGIALKKEWRGIAGGLCNWNISALLILAILCNQSKVIDTLLPTIKDSVYASLLELALLYNHQESFFSLLATNKEIIFSLSSLIFPARIFFIDTEFAQQIFNVVDTLDLNNDPHGRSLLFWSVILGIKKPLESASKAEIERFNNVSNNHMAFHTNRLAIYTIPFEFACRHDFAISQLLLKINAPIGKILLTQAATHGNFQLLNHLLTNTHLKNNAEEIKNALYHAASAGHLDCVRLILRYTSLTANAIGHAISMHQLHILHYFSKYPLWPALLNNVDFEDVTPVLYQQIHIPILIYLLKNGLDADKTDPETGKNLLHIVATRMNIDCSEAIDLLVKFEADIDKITVLGHTPLQLLIRNGDGLATDHFVTNIIAFLKAGANPYMVNCRNGSAIFYLQRLKRTDKNEIHDLIIKHSKYRIPDMSDRKRNQMG